MRLLVSAHAFCTHKDGGEELTHTSTLKQYIHLLPGLLTHLTANGDAEGDKVWSTRLPKVQLCVTSGFLC